MLSRNIELHPAFVFDCDSCGRENFVRSVVREFDEETVAEMREDHGIQPWEVGDFQMAPESVTCKYCGCKYEVNHD